MSGDAATAPPRKGCRRGCLVALGVLVAGAIALLIAHRPILEAIPHELVLRDPEETADAIVVLAGDGGERVEHAVELWKAGRSRTGLVFLSGGPLYWTFTWSHLMAEHAAALGVPKEDLVEQPRSRTTAEDADETVKLLLDRKVASIVLVTSAWHSRRAKAEFVRAAQGRFRVISCPCAEPDFPEGWWHDAPATRAIVTELLKYLW